MRRLPSRQLRLLANPELSKEARKKLEKANKELDKATDKIDKAVEELGKAQAEGADVNDCLEAL